MKSVYCIYILLSSMVVFGQRSIPAISPISLDFLKSIYSSRDYSFPKYYVSAGCSDRSTIQEIKKVILQDVISVKMTSQRGEHYLDTILVLSKTEQKFIDSNLNTALQYFWTQELVNTFESRLEVAIFDTISKNRYVYGDYIIPPILIKENSVCIFYRERGHLNQPLGRSGSLDIYKFKNGEWKYVFSPYSWVS